MHLVKETKTTIIICDNIFWKLAFFHVLLGSVICEQSFARPDFFIHTNDTFHPLLLPSAMTRENNGSFASINASHSEILKSELTRSDPFENIFKTASLETSSVSGSPHETVSVVSCKGRCGERQSFPCSCSEICTVYGNCCHDMEELCPSIFKSGVSRFKHLEKVNVKCSSTTFTFMITSCPTNTSEREDKNPREKSYTTEEEIGDRETGWTNSTPSSEQLNTTSSNSINRNRFISLIFDLPVTEAKTGLVYMNHAVAKCNGVLESDTLPWTLEIGIDSIQNPRDLPGIDKIILPDTIVYKPPKSKKTLSILGESECIPQSKRECKQKWLLERPDLKPMCLGGGITYHETFYPLEVEAFDNIYCVLCSSGTTNSSKPVLKSLAVDKNFKLSLVASFTSNSALEVKVASGNKIVSWGTLQCTVPTEELEDGKCSITSCGSHFVKRPDGECRVPQNLVLAIRGEDCTFVRHEETENKLGSLIKCYLETFQNSEIDSKTIKFETAFDNNLNRSFLQLSARVYSPYLYWSVRLQNFLKEFSLIVHDANFICEPQPLVPHACSSYSCRFVDSELPLTRTEDFGSLTSETLLETVEPNESTSDNKMVLCGSITPNLKITPVLECLQNLDQMPKLSLSDRLANVTCFGGNVDNQHRRGPCNSTKKIGREGTWFAFVLVVLRFWIQQMLLSDAVLQ